MRGGHLLPNLFVLLPSKTKGHLQEGVGADTPALFPCSAAGRYYCTFRRLRLTALRSCGRIYWSHRTYGAMYRLLE